MVVPAGWDYVQSQHRAVGGYEQSAAIVHSITGEELRRYPRSEQHTPDWLRQGAETA